MKSHLIFKSFSLQNKDKVCFIGTDHFFNDYEGRGTPVFCMALWKSFMSKSIKTWEFLQDLINPSNHGEAEEPPRSIKRITPDNKQRAGFEVSDPSD